MVLGEAIKQEDLRLQEAKKQGENLYFWEEGPLMEDSAQEERAQEVFLCLDIRQPS